MLIFVILLVVGFFFGRLVQGIRIKRLKKKKKYLEREIAFLMKKEE